MRSWQGHFIRNEGAVVKKSESLPQGGLGCHGESRLLCFLPPLALLRRRNGIKESFKYETNPVSRLHIEGVPILHIFLCFSAHPEEGNKQEDQFMERQRNPFLLKDQVSYV